MWIEPICIFRRVFRWHHSSFSMRVIEFFQFFPWDQLLNGNVVTQSFLDLVDLRFFLVIDLLQNVRGHFPPKFLIKNDKICLFRSMDERVVFEQGLKRNELFAVICSRSERSCVVERASEWKVSHQSSPFPVFIEFYLGRKKTQDVRSDLQDHLGQKVFTWEAICPEEILL